MIEARNSRMEHLNKYKKMIEDNNTINKIVEDQKRVIKKMHIEGLMELKCVKYVKEGHYEVISDERCLKVVEEFENASYYKLIRD